MLEGLVPATGAPTEVRCQAAAQRRMSTLDRLMIISIPKETISGERRVALVPELVPRLTQSGMDVLVQHEAGTAAGFPDSAYLEKGAHLEPEVFSTADVLLKVQPPTLQETARLKEGTLVIGFLQPYSHPSEI